jgi:aldehyde dehydrogenase (NAD+)
VIICGILVRYDRSSSAVIENTQSGSTLANDTLILPLGSSALLVTFSSHPRFDLLSAEGLPFGGIGPSGCRSIAKMILSSCLMIHVPLVAGCSTGKFSFDMFTHLRASLDNPGLFVTFHWHADQL